MNTLRLLTASLLTFCNLLIFAQTDSSEKSLYFELRQMPESNTWGVFLSPSHQISPSEQTCTGSGQVTIVAPVNFTYSNFKNYSGTWIQNARVDAPVEALDKSYISFGFVTDEPKIKIFPKQRTLLFTFTANGDRSTKIALIDNDNDPFSVPNSYGSNPGNELGMIDFGSGQVRTYTFASIISSERTQNNKAESNSDISTPKAIFANEHEVYLTDREIKVLE